MPQRSSQQNRAMHQYFRMLADALNETDYTPRDLGGEVNVPATAETVERYLWRPHHPDEEVTEIHEDAFEFIATTFNEVGLDFRMLMPESDELEWTPIIVKEAIWKPVQYQTVGKWHTSDLDMYGEIGEVYKELEGDENTGKQGLLRKKFPELEPVEFPHEERDDIDYPEPDIDPEDIPF